MGVNLNIADSNGDTALHFASKCGFNSIVSFLLLSNAVVVTNKQGMVPKDVALTQAIADIFVN